MSQFRDKLAALRTNPTLMQHAVLDELESQLGDDAEYDVPDASNPFVFLMEAAVSSASMAVTEGEALLRRLYPSMALTSEELYLHMSDDDYLGRFDSPAWTHFELYLSKAEVMAKALPVGDTGVKKLVIPRQTRFEVADTVFTMQYPVEIRLMSHGGLHVVYDTTSPSPIQTLESNLVDWDVVRLRDEELLLLRLPVGQFQIETFQEVLNQTAGFDNEYGFSDKFYHARVYLTTGSRGWREIHTTHTEQVFDPLTPTAVLKVVGNTLQVKVPLVYFSQGMMTGEIRIDIYTTKGQLDMDLGSYEPNQFRMVLNDIDDAKSYVAPLKGFSRIQALSPEHVVGGASGVSFVDLRRQVIGNSLGASRVPITKAQLGTQLENLGYTVVTNIDNLTNRQFLATRRLPRPQSENIAGEMGCVMGQFHLTVDRLAASPHVANHGDRITLLPSMLYEYQGGVVRMVPEPMLQQVLTMGVDEKARHINGKNYLYSPLHYVLDATNDAFDVRPYYLDQPEVVRKVFVDENNTAQLQVSVEAHQFARIDGGYRLTVKLTSGDRFKAIDPDLVFVQLGYRPLGENSYASLNGVRIGEEDDEGIYQFDILTEFDIDAQGGLYTTNFSMFDEAQRHFATPLEGDFDISFVVAEQSMQLYKSGTLDSLVQHHLLPDNVMVISRERFRLRFGHALTNLWRRNRTLISEQSYRRYEADVPYLYTQTVYARDENGQIILGQDTEGNVTYEILHAKGDPVLDGEGNPVMRYLKGDVVLDGDGKPELLEARKLLREITLFLLDGIYYFVNDEEAIRYREAVPDQLVTWLNTDIGRLQKRLMEQSDLYLYPTQTIGNTTAIVREGLQSTVSLDQHVYVNYYLTDTAYSNVGIREGLLRSTRELVNSMLGRSTIAISDIVARLKENAGEDVISIEIGGLGGSNNYSTLSITDDAVRMSLRRRMVVLSNQLLSAQDDIDVNFLRHSLVK